MRSSTAVRKAMSAGALACALVGAVPPAARAGHDATTPSDIPAGWLQSITQSLAREEYFLAPDHSSGALTAPNRAQDLRGRWEAGALVVTPREGAAWSFSYELAGIARMSDRLPDAPPALISESIDAGRLEWVREGAVSEWYVNDARGIEQGFTLHERPPGPADQPIVVEGRIEGLLAMPAEDGQSILFKTATGEAALRVSQLVVTDASGMRLPACFDLAPGSLAILVDDRDAAYPIVVDPILSSASWTIDGDQAGAGLGASVAAAGDVNGDGFADAIVGAPRHDGGETDEGRALVYLGSASGLALTPAWSAEGGQAGASFGASVGMAGDVNGDGYWDVVVGAPGFDGGETDEGAAFVFHGHAGGLSPAADWSAEGGQIGAGFGFSAATAGDVNGDGFADVIVGAYLYDTFPIDDGRAVVFAGSAAGLSPASVWTARGTQSSAYFGVSVASAGDVNGDGFDDVIIGAHFHQSGAPGEGRAVTYHGSATGLGSSIVWTKFGGQPDAHLGRSVAGVGDLNGDGYDDVVVGAPQCSVGETFEGCAFAFLGSASGLQATASGSVEGGQVNAQLGISVAGAGDVNGDGYSDVIIGAHLFDEGSIDEGRASIHLGSAAGSLGPATWTAPGGQADARFGGAVAGLGDVDADGFADVAVGASSFDGYLDGGRVEAFMGAGGSLMTAAAWAGRSPDPGGTYFGLSVASAGDVNGDGYSDIIVGAPWASGGWGRAYAFHGSAQGPESTPSWSVDRMTWNVYESTWYRGGKCVASAGDVNGDGYSDVVVTAESLANSTWVGGLACVFHGSPSGLRTSAAWSAHSDIAYDAFGASAASAGDVNGDGLGDLVVGAPGKYDQTNGRAAAYLGTGTGLSPTPSWTVAGTNLASLLGASVASAGDVNGDGFSDVAIGVPQHDADLPDEGAVLVYHGSSLGLLALPTWTVEGNQAGSLFGASVATAGDVNGDGHSDLLVGAMVFDDGQAEEGAAFLYTGSPSGLSRTPTWQAGGNQTGASFGVSVASAGDVNGDGFSDIIVGANTYDGVIFNSGRAILYLGSATGPGATPATTIEGTASVGALGASVAPAGDVNGDGFSDVIVGETGYPLDRWNTDHGRAQVFFGNSAGNAVVPRQRRFDDRAPVHLLGNGDPANGYAIHASARSATGIDRVRLEVEVEPLGVRFDGIGLLESADAAVGPGVVAPELVVAIPATIPGPQRWRARLRGMEPAPWLSPWWSPAGNAVTETDVRLGSTISCLEPSAGDMRPGAVPLGVAKVAPVDVVTLTWENLSGATYNVYGGNLADVGPARPVAEQVACRVATNRADVPAIGAGRWFVVASSCSATESPLGRDSYGVEHDRASAPCP